MQLKRSEAGFTLVELLVAVVILGVITIPLSGVVVSALKHTGTSEDRLALSHDAQLSSSYFARDVAALGVRDYDAAPSESVPFKASVQLDAVQDAGGVTCGPAPEAAIRLLSDRWDGSSIPAVHETDVVAYYVEGSELHRLKCAGTTTDVVIAHNVKPGSLTVACSSTCTSDDPPQRITISFLTSKPSVGDYPITLIGQRRQS
ncbi:prepilin-type N-terminal cleavage/methylation domain-containing protein [Kribbella sp. VKM Ac-2527]|uniref:Prepilin-type N-terminal cleavage/methylation domain-containing protein n=1 Tax=Kribbella caucasensis TaxID=2512215 RepID=A0A4R6JHY1_9ACTN|nr:prepilin-type N-terminal cleavage/methylation domain-containing protein [Kribbella sp. VKM Ac-2527]TDO35714.1 prepilin-type N-terminal cleavage/methylation domain-containing protein [Kribbella sp. VKM Ac-2527]